MNKVELLEIIRNGVSSGVEFKRDDIPIQDRAREIVGFANYQGGMILLGVEDDGKISGIKRQNTEEWVMEACRTKVEPEIMPYYETVVIEKDKRVACLQASGRVNIDLQPVPGAPLDGLREAVLNAICHRDYTDPADTIIKIYDDYISI